MAVTFEKQQTRRRDARSMAHPSREQCLYIAELAGEAERFDGAYAFDDSGCLTDEVHVDVVTQIKTIIMNIDQRLALEERNLLSVAYKNITNNLRASWRIVDTLEKVQAARSKNAASRQLQLIRHQREIIEKELTNVCKDIVELLDKQLLPYAQTGEEQVFYSKMCVSRRPHVAIRKLTCLIGRATTIDT